MRIKTHVAGGLPCLVELTSYTPGLPAKTSGPPEHCYPAEPEEIEYEFLTLKGKPAPWIERRASQKDLWRIEEELLSAIDAEEEY